MNLSPVTLSGSLVTLEPLQDRHAADLLAAAAHDEVWTYLDEPTPVKIEQVQALIADAKDERRRGARLAFAMVDKASGTAVGSTSYIDIRPQDRGLEIGWVWSGPSVWGTGINAEAFYLLLRHAFDDQDVIRVALKTDRRNLRSQRAIEALGASREGLWRNHRILSTGNYRDTVYYSVIDAEWPTIRSPLEARLSRLRARHAASWSESGG